MEGCIVTEEQVTKVLLSWLIEKGWEIVCFDFPQSGTGRLLHPNNAMGKNKNAINPDIVAVKEPNCLFFENKGYFYFSDFEKVNELRNTDIYSDSINMLLKKYDIQNILYGIGYPVLAHKKKAKESLDMVDFIVGVEEDRSIVVLYQNYSNGIDIEC